MPARINSGGPRPTIAIALGFLGLSSRMEGPGGGDIYTL
jgi:hypothetical protein